MSTLNIVVNCVILVVGLREIFAVPTGVTDQSLEDPMETAATEPIVDFDKCPCARNLSNWPPKDCQWDQLNVRNVMMHGMVCTCNVGNRCPPPRDDYRHTPGIGSHKLHTRSVVWNVARKLCNEEGGHLAIVNSIAEAHILQDIFNRSGPIKDAGYPDVAFLGMHDLYTEGDWVTILGDSLAKTGFTEWSDKWGGQPDNGGGVQNCGAFMKEGKLDDLNCDVPFPFFCEIPLVQML